MLYDINKDRWSDELLKIFNIPKKILPQVAENVYNFGSTTITGFNTIIGGVAGDQQAALIGQCCFNKGMSKSTFGTGGFILMNIGSKVKFSKNKLLTSIAYKIGNKKIYCLEGSIFIAGSAIKWLRDGIKVIKNVKDTERLYYQAKKNQNLIVVPTFTGLGAPYWLSNIEGSIHGINQNTNIQDIVKATIESICFQTKDLVNIMEKDSNYKIKEMRVDGGMSNNEPFIRFLSNILNINIKVPLNTESTSLGVAYLSSIQSGIIKNFNQINKKNNLKKSYNSNFDKAIIKKMYEKWLKTLKKIID